MIESLMSRGILRSDRVIAAFRAVPREDFVPEEYHDEAYDDTALPLAAGQTISAPHMVAHMTELLDPQPGDRVLEIGAGSGYQAAILAEMVDRVYTLEIVEELAEQARERLEPYGNVTVVHGDGSTGYEAKAPYDKIMYTAAAPKIPEAVFDQLITGGILVAPVGEARQELRVYTKEDGSIAGESYYAVRFVPLKGEEGQPD